MKKSLFTLLVLMLFGSVYAQNYDPNSHYQTLMVEQGIMSYHGNNASFMGQIYIDGVPNDNLDIEIGCYDMQDPGFVHLVGGIYGVMESGGVQYDHPVYFLTVYGEAGDRIIFMLYDHSIGQELPYVCEEEYSFVVDGIHLGYEWHFISPKDMVFAGLEDNQWSNAANWIANGEPAGRIPKAFENASIEAPCLVDMDAVAATVTVTAGNSLTMDEGSLEAELIIEDGAQLFTEEEMTATIQKNINPNDWYLISGPVQNFDYTGFEAAGMFVNDYDLYIYDKTYYGPINPDEDPDYYMVNGEWRNYKYYANGGEDYEGNPFSVSQFTPEFNGYLYANSGDVTLDFTGNVYVGAYSATIPLGSNEEDEIGGGLNLVGNPYPCNATVGSIGSNINPTFYVMNNGSLIPDNNPTLAPATSLFVVCTATSGRPNTRAFNLQASEGRSVGTPCINIEVLSKDGVLEDRAYVNIEESHLVKYSLSDNGTKIYIPQNGKRYAAAYAGEAKAMPLCFTSTEGGIHTITVKAENMSCSYLHLIDNVTGADIDLLRTPKYSFDANDSNYATRFKLVFDETATNEIVDSFAFISNGELMITNNGEATLQVMDITGRILSTENIQNCYSKSLNLSAGVYVVRLSNGNDVKAQKIVVE